MGPLMHLRLASLSTAPPSRAGRLGNQQTRGLQKPTDITPLCVKSPEHLPETRVPAGPPRPVLAHDPHHAPVPRSSPQRTRPLHRDGVPAHPPSVPESVSACLLHNADPGHRSLLLVGPLLDREPREDAREQLAVRVPAPSSGSGPEEGPNEYQFCSHAGLLSDRFCSQSTEFKASTDVLNAFFFFSGFSFLFQSILKVVYPVS